MVVWGCLLVGCGASQHKKMLREEFGNLTFPSEWTASGFAPLDGGTYREPAAPGSATEIAIRLTDNLEAGNLAGRESAAVVLVTEPGGSGSFYSLALLQRFPDRWEIIDVARLGDRIRLDGLAINENGIRIEMIVHGPGDPMCCPTGTADVRFALDGGKLRKTLPQRAMPLAGRVWKWRRTIRDNNGDTAPPTPERYTIAFLEDGRIRVLADCNSAGGGFTVHNEQIAITIAYSTMPACPPTSLAEVYKQDILSADTFHFHEDQLHLKSIDTSGTMIFAPDVD